MYILRRYVLWPLGGEIKYCGSGHDVCTYCTFRKHTCLIVVVSTMWISGEIILWSICIIHKGWISKN